MAASRAEIELLRSFSRGEEEALEGFHRLWGAALKHYLESRFRRLGVSVEDVYQETLIKVWRSASSYVEGKGSPSTWVFAISRNVAIDHLRRDQELRARLEGGFVAFARGHAQFQGHREDVLQQLGGLSGLERAVVEADLRTFPAEDDARLAGELETTSGSVQAQRSRAYRKLNARRLKRRDALGWLGEEGDPAVARLLGWRPGRKPAGAKS